MNSDKFLMILIQLYSWNLRVPLFQELLILEVYFYQDM